MLRMYHLWVIHQTHRDVQIDELVLAGFDVYRVVFYEDHVNAVKRGSKGKGNADLERWMKGIKPNRSKYPTLKGGELWTRFKEDMEATAESQGLIHTLVEPSTPIVNPELDNVQRKWMFKSLKDKMRILLEGVLC